MDDEIRALFRRYDDPRLWESPNGFDYEVALRRFRGFVDALESFLGQSLETETFPLIQDASFHSQICFSGGYLRFSSFGNMIAFTPDHRVSPLIVEAVVRLALQHQYQLVPTEDLEAPYTGSNPGVTGISTWWIRFFDWV